MDLRWTGCAGCLPGSPRANLDVPVVFRPVNTFESPGGYELDTFMVYSNGRATNASSLRA